MMNIVLLRGALSVIIERPICGRVRNGGRHVGATEFTLEIIHTYKMKLRRSDIVHCDHNARACCISCMDVDLGGFVIEPKSVAVFEKCFRSTSPGVVRALHAAHLPPTPSHNHHNPLSYGEISFYSFAYILHKAGLRDGDSFVDLGAGIGKAVVAAALSKRLRSAVGVELLGFLHQLAEELLETCRRDVGCADLDCVSLIQGDLFAHDISAADVVFVSTTCFSEDMLVQLGAKCDAEMKSGARVITLSTPLRSERFHEVHSGKYRMSWGNATVFIAEKTT